MCIILSPFTHKSSMKLLMSPFQEQSSRECCHFLKVKKKQKMSESKMGTCEVIGSYVFPVMGRPIQQAPNH